MNIVPRISEGLRSPSAIKVREHRRLARARGSSTEAVVGGIANAPPFRNADSRFADRVFKSLQRELGAIVDAEATWTGDHDRKRASAWCQQNMSRKRSNFPEVPLIRLASIRRFSRSAITRQLPDQALGDTAQDEARGDIAEPMRKQHNAGQD